MTTQSLSLLLYISIHPFLLRLTMVAAIAAAFIFVDFAAGWLGEARFPRKRPLCESSAA